MRRHYSLLALLLVLLGLSATTAHAQVQLSVSMTTTPACSLDGSATVTVTGGTAPYTYNWYTISGSITTSSNTLTGLAGGYCYVSVYDANQMYGWANGTVASPFTVAVSATDELCGDGTGTATASVVSGGTGPFTYAWSNGMTGSTITGLHQGQYEFTITDVTGCFVASNQDSSMTAFVQNGTTMTGSVTSTPSVCTDGSLAINNLAGGTPPYSYVWGTTPVQTTPVASNLPGGIWGIVTVTDAVGCELINYWYVNQAPNGLSLNMSHVNETCIQSNGSVTAFPSGGTAPYTYLWSNGATTQTASGLSYGSYYVTVTDANLCPQVGYEYVGRTDPLTLSITATPPACNNTGGALSVGVTGGAAPYTYQWNTGATTSSLSGLTSGYYSVTVTDANGCYDHTYYHLDMPSSCYGVISGSIVGDQNGNCIQDIGDFAFVNRWVSFGSTYAYTDGLGNYSKNLFPGNYVVSQPVVATNFTQLCPTSPATYTVSNLQPLQLVNNQDFFNVASTSINDLSISFYAEPARPTAQQNVYIYYRNDGTTSQNVTINYVHDALMTLVFGGYQMTGYNSGTRTVSYNLGVLHPYQYGSITLSFSIPTSTPLGTTYTQSAEILPMSADATPLNNQQTVNGTVVASYDPNAKSVSPDGQITLDDSVLTYMVQFQNTGNDTAFTVAIEDVIDPSLDLVTLEVLGSSHPYTVDASGTNTVHFRFANIMLPDSNINEPLSHGHIIYRIHTKPNLPLGTQIHNTAGIYFDYNAPVITNTTLNTLGTVGAADPVAEAGFMLFPNPAKGQVSLRLADNWAGQTQVNVRDLSGKVLSQMVLDPAQSRQAQLDLQRLSAGVYLVECVTDGQRMVRKLVLQ